MTSSGWPTVREADIAWIDTAAMVEVDRVMIEELHIELIQMMENAGRNLAALVHELVGPTTAAVYVGSGGNGGGGLVAARHLANRGVAVTVVLGRPPDQLSEVARHQFDIVERMGVRVADSPVAADVAVDALIGYSLRGAPTGRVAELIEAISSEEAAVVSLDVPSGLDTTTGETPGVAIRADATLTLALPKVGLQGHSNVGRLFVGDISVPPAVYARFGLPATPIFASGPILEITS